MALRTNPVQSRAKSTVDKIIAAAKRLLIEGGPEAMSTSAIAKETELNLRSIYRYFPNRVAIFSALNAEINEHIAHRIDELFTQDNQQDLSTLATQVVAELLVLAEEEPVWVQVRAAMRMTPELQQQELSFDKQATETIVAFIQARGSSVSKEMLTARVFVMVSMIGACLDRVLLDPMLDRAPILAEMNKLIEVSFGDLN